mmetsp:Transcript_8484/g.18601  ORF Transcript_8484/g.18601 Transcript_8484/m.18601 type:complete len:125 (-) Transcript_8484:32-406(-)
MVRMSVLADCLKTISNAEKRGRRQVMVRPSSKVVIKFLRCMQQHGKFSPSVDPVLLPVCIPCPSLVHTTNNKNNNNNHSNGEAVPRDSEPNSRDSGSAIVQNRPSPCSSGSKAHPTGSVTDPIP